METPLCLPGQQWEGVGNVEGCYAAKERISEQTAPKTDPGQKTTVAPNV